MEHRSGIAHENVNRPIKRIQFPALYVRSIDSAQGHASADWASADLDRCNTDDVSNVAMIASNGSAMKVTPLEARRRVSKTANQTVFDAHAWSEQMAAVAQRQDVESFMRIYDYFSPRVHRYLIGLGLDDAQGQELMQEAMLRLWRRAAQFDPARASLSTWLFRIARNLYIDHIRGEPSWLPLAEGMDWLDEQELGDTPSTPESYADHVSLKEAIEDLTAIQARLVRMSYFEAKSHSEIAQELNMPLGSVKSHLRRAFSKLQSSMRSSS